MKLEQALYTKLSTTSGITSLVSTRIYPLRAAQGAARPYVVYQRISDNPVHAMGSDCTLMETRMQFSAVAETFSSALNVHAALMAALRDLTGTIGGTGGVSVQRAFYDERRDYVESDETGGDEVTVTVQSDYIFWHTES